MTAERYELRADHTDWLDVRDPQGYRNTINQPGAIALIRQQARDIAGWDRLFTAVVSQSLPNAPSLWPFDGEQGPAMVAFAIHQLRTDLAAAIAENAALLAANRDCILHFDAIKTDYDAMKLRAEQAEARLAVIDAAPTVATVCIVPSTQRVYVSIDVEQYDLPPVGTHLIARPAKD